MKKIEPNINKTLTVADIYCGAGGMSSGLAQSLIQLDSGEKVGFEVVYGMDRDADAMDSFRAYHFAHLNKEQQQKVAPCIDVEDVSAAGILEAIAPHKNIDVLVGGPNCQGVSTAGLRNPDDKRNLMLNKFIDLVDKLRPKWFVMENVPGLTHSNNRVLLREIFKEFDDLDGYQVCGDVLLAANFGVPQLRYRVFIIGTQMRTPIRFPKPTHSAPDVQKNLLTYKNDSYVTVEDAIKDLSGIEPSYIRDTQPIASPIVPNHSCPTIGDENLRRIKQIKQGEDWRNMPVGLLPERYFNSRTSDQKGSYGRLMWDWPAYTITNATSNVTAGAFTHPEHHRALSVREAARLQSFQDSHVLYGNVMSQYRQVGNAVPPLMAKAVGEALLRSHYSHSDIETTAVKGRINLKLLEDVVIKGKKSKWPILTPRQVHPLYENLGKRKTVPTKQKQIDRKSVEVWQSQPRPADPFPEHTKILRVLAQQSGNFRAAKRAAAIVAFLDERPKTEIVDTANVAETSVEKWVNGYFAEGLHGWRAYHTPLERIANHDLKIIVRLQENTKKVRWMNLQVPSDGSEHKRLHMNPYLVHLIKKYSCLSIAELIHLVETKLGYGIGTIYTDDLLAICDTFQVAGCDSNE